MIQVALPVLANQRLGGASARGLLLGMHGLGMLLGMLASNMFGKLRVGNFGITMLAINVIAGIVLAPMGEITAAWQGALMLLTVGGLSGFMQISVFGWVQQRVAAPMLGQTMSIFMFIFMGLAPLSAIVIGWLLQIIPISQLFASSSASLVLVALLTFWLTPMRALEDPTELEEI